jgi:hypothetical protein
MLATHDWSMGVQTLLMIGPSGTSSAMPRWLVSKRISRGQGVDQLAPA